MKNKIMLVILIILILLLVFVADKKSEKYEKENENEIKDNIKEKEEIKNIIEENSKKKKVKVYFFWGKNCSSCEDLKKYFIELNLDYGKYFELETFEVWEDEENKKLWENVRKELDDKKLVPYVVIGKEVLVGSTDKIKKEIKRLIMYEYKSGNNYDVMEKIEKT